MALRFGYQFGTTGFRHANPISYRSRSLSPIPRRQLSIKELETSGTVFTSPRCISPVRFSPRQANYSDFSIWKTQTDTDNRPKSASGRYMCNPVSNRELQPSRLTPIASTYIHNNTLNSCATFRTVNVEKLQDIANSQYRNAVKALNKAQEEDDKAYVLNDAVPVKRSASDPHLLIYKKQYTTNEDKMLRTPKLQPKNIKPLGVPNNEDWCSSLKKIEKLKALSHRQRQSPMQLRPKSSTFNKVSPALKSNYAQQRKYSATQNDGSASQINLQYPQESNNNHSQTSNYLPTIYNENANFLGVQTNKQDQLQTSEEAIARADGKFLKPQVTPFYNLSDNTSPTKQMRSGNMTSGQPHLQSRPSNLRTEEKKGNVILYYKERNGKKTLCSKIVRDNKSDLSLNPVECPELSTIKKRAGPKLMLQSMEDCVEYSPKELKPAHNEIFMVPWPSWGDRVKLRQRNKYYQHNETKVSSTKLDSETTSSLQTSAPTLSTLQPQPF
ncbi:hypothetical protein QE152_g38073 [Popillia japonica]|uniref:Uncharacterized protein n=1 Tax=Popillia japonica TaxID=7064 RepID=A0AAW1I8U5_POPJA